MTLNNGSQKHCSSIQDLTQVAENFTNKKEQNGKDMGALLEECIDLLSNYKKECKQIKSARVEYNGKEDDSFKLFESAYVYYKIIHLIILSKIPNLNEFKSIKGNERKKSKDQELMQIYNTLVNTLLNDDMISDIKAHIKENSLQKDTRKAKGKQELFSMKNGSLISSYQLKQLLYGKNDNTSVLLIDIRPRLEFSKSHIKHEEIICVEPISFKDSYSDEEVAKKSLITSPNEEIDLFNKRNEFEFIILYTNDKEKAYYNQQMVFLEILLTHSFAKPLDSWKTKVLILENGISSWSLNDGPVESTRTNIPKDGETNANKDINKEDSVYINGNTSGLSLQTFPKAVPGISATMDNTMKDMMSSSSSPDYSIRQKQQSPFIELKRTSSFKNFFSNFKSSSSADISKGTFTPSNHYSSPTSAIDLTPSASQINFNTQKSLYPEAPNLEKNETLTEVSYVSPLNQNIRPINARAVAPLSRSLSGSTRGIPTGGIHQKEKFHAGMTLNGNSTDYNISKSEIFDSNNRSEMMPSSSLPPISPTKTGIPNKSALHTNDKMLDLDFIVGLQNIGNSCYLNCIIQCLLGTHELTKIFLNNFYERHINLNSKLGSKGVLAKYFARLIHLMHNHANPKLKNNYVRPAQFKMAVGSVNTLFKNCSQQDCQEFCQFLLDGLHEDLNQCGSNPPLKELSSAAEKNREKLSLRIASSIEWERFLTTDFSVIVDLFQGQYASRLQCEVCKHTSTTYQPFSVLSAVSYTHLDVYKRQL